MMVVEKFAAFKLHPKTQKRKAFTNPLSHLICILVLNNKNYDAHMFEDIVKHKDKLLRCEFV